MTELFDELARAGEAFIDSKLGPIQAQLTAKELELLNKNEQIIGLSELVEQLQARIEELENQTPADPGELAYWGVPAWRDEFDTPGLDTSKWNARNDTTVSYDQAVIYTAQNQVPGDGFLHQKIESLPTPVNRAGRLRYFKVGYLDTIGKFAQRYGRWEVRAKLPLTPNKSFALWPAFWLRDQSGAGEVDIMEAIGTPHRYVNQQPEGVQSLAMHSNTDGSGGSANNLKRIPPASEVYLADDEFHTFAVEWTPTGFKFLTDGYVVWDLKTSQYPWFETAFPGGVNIRLNCQVGESWMGLYDPNNSAYPYLNGTSTVLPAEMTVDYVRVWKMPA